MAFVDIKGNLAPRSAMGECGEAINVHFECRNCFLGNVKANGINLSSLINHLPLL
jgi:hypothetical protein